MSAWVWRPSTKIIDCPECGKSKRVHARNLCQKCYQKSLCIRIIAELERDFKPASAYNHSLFALYLTYTRRLKTQSLIVSSQAKRLAAILEKNSIPPILDWVTVDAYSKKYMIGYNRTRGRKNCAWLRIGHMLQEIGILPNLQHEQSIAIRNHLQTFDEKTLLILQKYIALFQRRRRLPKTIVLNLVSLRFVYLFLKRKDPALNLLLMTQKLFEEFVTEERLKFKDPLTMNPRLYHLKHFYRWAKVERLIITDPCQSFIPPRKTPRIYVCSDEQICKLIAWIKNPKSDSKYAMTIALTLFFGLTARDIASAKIEIKDDQFCLQIPQTIGPYRRTSFRMSSCLTLPREPDWFLQLQKRFYSDWRAHYAQLRTPHPVPWLVLPGNARTNNPSSYSLIRKWMKKATVAATSVDIPIRYIRQSCGQIYSTDSDASILSRFGWAPSTAFKYVWTPRALYSRPKKSSHT